MPHVRRLPSSGASRSTARLPAPPFSSRRSRFPAIGCRTGGRRGGGRGVRLPRGSVGPPRHPTCDRRGRRRVGVGTGGAGHPASRDRHGRGARRPGLDLLELRQIRAGPQSPEPGGAGPGTGRAVRWRSGPGPASPRPAQGRSSGRPRRRSGSGSPSARPERRATASGTRAGPAAPGRSETPAVWGAPAAGPAFA